MGVGSRPSGGVSRRDMDMDPFVLILCFCVAGFLALTTGFMSSVSKLEVRRRLLPRWHELPASGDEWHVLGWVWSVIRSSEHERRQLAGDEGVVYLQVQWVLLRTTAAVALLANLVLVPVNLSGGAGLTSFAAADSFNVEEGSFQYWWHTGFVAVTTAVMLGTLYQLSKITQHAATNDKCLQLRISLCSVKIFQLPNYKSEHEDQTAKLKHYLGSRFENKLLDVQVAPELWGLRKLGEKYQQAADGKASTDELHRLKQEIDAWCKPPLMSAGVAYITFKTPEDAQECIKTHAEPTNDGDQKKEFKDLGGRYWKMEQAPSPRDIIWRHLGIGWVNRFLRFLGLNFAIIFLLATIVSPVTVSDYLKKHVGSVVGALSTQFIPMAVLFLFLWILVPIVLHCASKYEGHTLKSDRADSFIKKYFCYLFVAAVILPLLNMALGVFIAYLYSNTDTFQNFAKRLYASDSGSNFLRYVMMWALLSTPLELFRFPMQIAACVVSCCRCSKKSQDTQPSPANNTAEEFDFALHYSLQLHVVSLIFFFSIATPVILIFGTIYLGLKHVVDLILLTGTHRRSKKVGVRQAITAQQLFLVCILLHLLGSAIFLTARHTQGAFAVRYIFWGSLLLYAVWIWYQGTTKFVQKRTSLTHVASVLEGDWLASPVRSDEALRSAHPYAKVEMVGSAAEAVDEEAILEGCPCCPALSPALSPRSKTDLMKGEYTHPWLPVYVSGVEKISEIAEEHMNETQVQMATSADH